MSSKTVVFALSLLLMSVLIMAGCAAPAAVPAGEALPAEGGEEADGGGKLEVFSWWTSGGEAAALDALFQAYNAAYPEVEIINATVAGGGGSAARPPTPRLPAVVVRQRALCCKRVLPVAIRPIPGKCIPVSS